MTGTDSELPFPSDGPDVKWINHAPHMTSAMEVNDCQMCAKELADFVLEELHIGILLCVSLCASREKGEGGAGGV